VTVVALRNRIAAGGGGLVVVEPKPCAVDRRTELLRSPRMSLHRSVRLLLASALAATAVGVTTLAASPAQAIPQCDVEDPPPICDGPVTTTTRRPTTTATTAPTNTATWFIDANTVHVNDAQEEGIFSNGDEFYIAQIAFRSTPGKAGSTTAFFQGGLTEVTSLDDGDTKTIPDSMGRVAFPNVTSRGFSDVLAGRNPEIIGTLSVVFESDATPFGTINNMMSSMASTARTEIAKVIEPLSLAALSDPQAISAKLAEAKERIAAQATPTTLQAIGLFLGSFGDPDDLVAFKANVFVAVDSSLAPTVDSQIGMNIPSATGVGGALRDRGYTQRFNGDGADYNVSYLVSR
jgi:hypothetical protein